MGAIIVAIIVFIIFLKILSARQKRIAKAKAAEERKASIYRKYGRTEVAEKIINNAIWVGATSEQLLDSWGKPLDIDENVLKTKKKEIWKYNRKSANRYGYKVKLENNIVIGWDEKM